MASFPFISLGTCSTSTLISSSLFNMFDEPPFSNGSYQNKMQIVYGGNLILDENLPHADASSGTKTME